ncbi:MAG: hypothetical protein LBC88_00040 [Spirochaetaceae bacterium]|jgi:hypothetical protein|nr:hypothetical protein [Spirochaetaceae bacterium]
MYRRFLLGGLLFSRLCLGGIAAQTAPADVKDFSLFVSELRAETRNNLIRLTWRDSAVAWGPVYIFRSTSPFGRTVSASITPAKVAYGMQVYVDEIDSAGTFYYAIAASSISGEPYDAVTPNVNTVAVIMQPPSEDAALAGGAGPLPELSISGLLARTEGEGVIITYNPGGIPESNLKKTILYRSSRPVRRSQDLLNAVIVQSGVSTPFVDYPIPGLPWYYAIVLEEDITSGSVTIYPGRNATTVAVEISGEGTSSGGGHAIRSLPLPEISAYNAAPESDVFAQIPKSEPLSRETLKALEGVQKKPAPAQSDRKPRAFARDLGDPAGGEDSELMRIVQNSFSGQDWRTAQDELLRYLALPRSPATEARARFYLGQTCYFSGKYREALVEFLFIQARHPAEAHIWIEATLAALIR